MHNEVKNPRAVAKRTSQIKKWTIVKYSNGECVLLGATDIVNITCLMRDTCLCQLDVK